MNNNANQFRCPCPVPIWIFIACVIAFAIVRIAVSDESTFPSGEEDGTYRTWTDNSGKFKVEAALLDVENDRVRLRRKRDNEIIQVPIRRLSKSDQDYIKKQNAPATSADIAAAGRIKVALKDQKLAQDYKDDKPKADHVFLIIDAELTPAVKTPFEVPSTDFKIYSQGGNSFSLWGFEADTKVGRALIKNATFTMTFKDADTSFDWVLFFEVPKDSKIEDFSFKRPE